MELRVFRQSGMPPRIKDYTAYQEEFALVADVISERSALNMEKSQRMFRYMERQLIKKHNTSLKVPMPQTPAEMLELINEFGTPVTFAQTKDGNEVIIMLMDEM